MGIGLAWARAMTVSTKVARKCAVVLLLASAALALASRNCRAQSVSVRSLFEVCDDKRPSGRHSCEDQKAWGKCAEKWFEEGNYCRKTCGRCVEFDPRRTELEVRKAMSECDLKDDAKVRICLDAMQGGEASGMKIRSQASGEASGLSIEELMESGSVLDLMTDCRVDCLVKHSSDILVRSVVSGFMESHEPKSEKLSEILTVDAASRLVLDWFKYVGCSLPQWRVVIPKLYALLVRHNPAQDRALLGSIYEIGGLDEATNKTVTYTSAFETGAGDTLPSASTCLAKSLKLFLSVRECDNGGGYHCYKGSRG